MATGDIAYRGAPEGGVYPLKFLTGGVVGQAIVHDGTKPVWGSAGTALPVEDTTALVKGSVTPTKLWRVEVDGWGGAATRVTTIPDADFVMAGANYANSWSGTQDFNGATLKVKRKATGSFDVLAAGEIEVIQDTGRVAIGV